MNIDLKQIAIMKLFASFYKNSFDATLKEAFRKGEKTIFNDYATVERKKYTRKYFAPEKQALIDQFIKENHIEPIIETIEDYTIEIVPTKKAKKEFAKMLATLVEASNTVSTKTVAEKLQASAKYFGTID